MKVYVRPGRAIDLGDGRTTSVHGGVYDLGALGVPEEAQAELLEHARVIDPAVATPEAAELAEDHGLELAELEGSGKGGRIVKGDVEKAIETAAVRASGDPGEQESE